MSLAEKQRIRSELISHLSDINNQILDVVKEARAQGLSPHLLRYADGKWVLNDLYLAKSQAYLALVMNNQKD